ncbi:MAG: hypothetical protein AABZ63_06415 [Actinomycetota bacterium]
MSKLNWFMLAAVVVASSGNAAAQVVHTFEGTVQIEIARFAQLADKATEGRSKGNLGTVRGTLSMAGNSASQTSWTMREADEIFYRGKALDHKKILGTWTRVAQVDITDRDNGRIDMNGLNSAADGGRITFSKKDNSVQSDLLHAQIHEENDRPVLADTYDSGKTKILGKTTRDRTSQEILSQRAYWCVQANPEIVLCEVDTLDGGRSDGSGSLMLFEYYAYARIK